MMPSLDRVITIGVQGPDGSEDGTPVPGEIVDTETWARQVDRRIDSSSLGAHAQELLSYRTFRVRYRDDLLAPTGRLSVLVDGVRHQVERVVEVERRRWIDLDILGEEA